MSRVGSCGRRPPPGPTLYRLAHERQHFRLIGHLKSNPQDVWWVDNNGSTVLHTLCLSHTFDIAVLNSVKAVVAEAPFLVGKCNRASWTPLHMACEKRLMGGCMDRRVPTTNDFLDDLGNEEDNGQEQLILLLLQAYPEACSMPLRTGFKAKTPFHIVCQNKDVSSLKILEKMLSVDPSLALRSSVKHDGPYTIIDTPLQILWDTIASATRTEAINDDDFLKMETLLKAAQKTTTKSTADGGDTDKQSCSRRNYHFPVLCAACSIRCPRDYASRLLQRYSEQVFQKHSRSGKILLHYAVQSAQTESPAYTNWLLGELLQRYPEGASIPLPQIPPSSSPEVQVQAQQESDKKNIDEEDNDSTSLGGNGAAARQETVKDSPRNSSPPSPLLAIHVLIGDRGCTSKDGGIQRLVQAYPNSLRIPDPRSGLVPALASAEVAIQSRMHLSTTYDLLRAAPDVIATANQ